MYTRGTRFPSAPLDPPWKMVQRESRADYGSTMAGTTIDARLEASRMQSWTRMPLERIREGRRIDRTPSMRMG